MVGGASVLGGCWGGWFSAAGLMGLGSVAWVVGDGVSIGADAGACGAAVSVDGAWAWAWVSGDVLAAAAAGAALVCFETRSAALVACASCWRLVTTGSRDVSCTLWVSYTATMAG